MSEIVLKPTVNAAPQISQSAVPSAYRFDKLLSAAFLSVGVVVTVGWVTCLVWAAGLLSDAW
jgi:hypothetical protein